MKKLSTSVSSLLRSKKLLQAEMIVLTALVVMTVVTLLLTNIPVLTVKQTANPIASVQAEPVQTVVEDKRVTILREYLKTKNSPLVPHAEDFIEAADAHGVDWKLVPSITGVESSFGRFIPGGHEVGYTSYNGWGWGVYGNQALKFKSWRDGIFTVTAGLKKNYINKGLTTPMAMNRVYAASPTWGVKVTFFMEDLSKFEKAYIETEVATVSQASFETSIAGASGELLAQAQ